MSGWQNHALCICMFILGSADLYGESHLTTVKVDLAGNG
jgi:hypothetical protein